MPQIFPRWTNSLSRATIGGGALALALASIVLGVLNRSPYETNASLIREQPVPFSHRHHVAGLGIDCRYCHTSVEDSSFAGLPDTHTCMSCHSQVWTNAESLAPVREAYDSGRPIRWTRVNRLPDYVFFDHSIHIRKGISCVKCHGRVDEMAMTSAAHSFEMRWCLSCHEHPQRDVRPREAVFLMDWKPPEDPHVARELRQFLAQSYHVKSRTSCYTCHR